MKKGSGKLIKLRPLELMKKEEDAEIRNLCSSSPYLGRYLRTKPAVNDHQVPIVAPVAADNGS
jgi:hypothetical protein